MKMKFIFNFLKIIYIIEEKKFILYYKLIENLLISFLKRASHVLLMYRIN